MKNKIAVPLFIIWSAFTYLHYYFYLSKSAYITPFTGILNKLLSP